MIATIKTPINVELRQIVVDIPIRYQDDFDDMLKRGVPFIRGEWDIDNYPRLFFTIDLNTARIVGWRGQYPFFVHTKPCDEGLYTLVGVGFEPRQHMGGEYYVPGCIPSSYGDYLVFSADSDGRIYTDLECQDRWVPNANDIVDDFWRDA